jgi:glycosyltransferase involved in cell wall biosynthesis
MVNPIQPPMVSVIMPVHNGAEWLTETLQALYAQTYQNFEIILIDDASTDHLDEVLSSQVDERLRVFRLPQNAGVSAARNRGISEALGRYVAFCDADDLCLPQRLQKQIEFLESQPEIGFCGSAFTCFDTEDRETVRHPLEHEEIRRRLMEGNCFGLSTVMVRTHLLQTCRFDSNLNSAEDYDLWTRLILRGEHTANLPEKLLKYRLHTSQISRKNSKDLDQILRKVRAYYCAYLLNNKFDWQNLLEQRTIKIEDLWFVTFEIEKNINQNFLFCANDFRFLLAWMYQKLSSHGISNWRQWNKIQKYLKLKLDKNYKFNIFLLAMLSVFLKHKYIDALIKLKI